MLQKRKGARNGRSYVGNRLRFEGLGHHNNGQEGAQHHVKSSRIADDTASGFSRGKKWPAPAITRRAANAGIWFRSLAFSGTGRAIPSSAPYKVITGTFIFGRCARRSSKSLNRGSPG